MKGGHAPWLGLAEVTDMATQQITLGHIMPNQGLVASQLCGVFRDAGLDPFVRNVGDLPLSDFSDKSKRQELLDRWNWILYSLQEGGMPILLFVRSGKVAHVITIVGHTYYVTQEPLRLYTFKGDFPEKEQHKWLSFHSTSDITKDFILHDPYFGPYELAELDYKETMTSRGKESIELVLKLKKPFGDRTSRDIESWSIDLVLAATPKEVSIDTVDAEVIAIRFWNMHIAKTDPFPASTDLVFRSLLLHNNEVKSHLGSGDTGLHKEVLTKLRPLSLPKWVYLVEIRHNTETEAAMRDGLILVDATTTSQRRRVLVVYYRDQMWIRSSLTNEPLPEMITEMKWLELNVEPNARFKAIHLPTDVKLNLPSTESTDESSTL